jgi:hypothetical protein
LIFSDFLLFDDAQRQEAQSKRLFRPKRQPGPRANRLLPIHLMPILCAS